MSNRAVMRHTNKLAVKWLLEHGYDYVHLKPHRDPRKARNMHEGFWRKDGFYHAPLDYLRLFDGFCYDQNGVHTWLQISTTNYHSIDPYVEFLRGKFGVRLLFIKAVKNKKRWEIRVKEITEFTTKDSKNINKPVLKTQKII